MTFLVAAAQHHRNVPLGIAYAVIGTLALIGPEARFAIVAGFAVFGGGAAEAASVERSSSLGEGNDVWSARSWGTPRRIARQSLRVASTKSGWPVSHRRFTPPWSSLQSP